MSSNTSSPSFTFSSDITFTLPLNQCYPTNIFKWMKKNAKPRMSLKLMQISKYFCYQRCPYLFTHNLEWFSEDDAFYYFHSHCYPNTRKKMKNSDKNLWLTGLLMLRQYPYILPKLIKCVIVCDVTFIHFEQQQIDFNDFKILTASGSVEILHCYGWTKIVDNFGEISPLEDILECLPNLKRLVFSCIVPSLTKSDISTLKISPHLMFVQLGGISEEFNFDNFVNFMKIYPKTKFSLDFSWPQDFSPDAYIQKLQSYVDGIIKDGLTNFRPPEIEFPKNNKTSLRKLRKLQEQFDALPQ